MRRDLLAGIAMFLIGILLVFILIPHGIVEPKKVRYAALSPSYYPRIIAGALAFLGLVIAFKAFMVRRAGGITSELAPESDQHPHAVRRIFFIFVFLAFYGLTVTSLGFILASSLVLLSTFWLAGERRLFIMLGLAIGLPLVLYFFFLKVAGIPIPLGFLEAILAGI